MSIFNLTLAHCAIIQTARAQKNARNHSCAFYSLRRTYSGACFVTETGSFFYQEKSMNGKEALFKMTDLINTVIHALNDINADESNCVVSVLEQCIEYSNIIYEELDKKSVGE